MAVLLMFAERLHSCFHGFAKVGAALRNQVHIDKIDMLAQGLLVDSQRTLQESRSGKRDEPKTVALSQFQ